VRRPEPSSISPSVRDALAVIHQQALELIVQGASLDTVLDALCDGIDALDPDLISSVLLADPDGQRLWPQAGRRVPEGWKQFITPVPIGPSMGAGVRHSGISEAARHQSGYRHRPALVGPRREVPGGRIAVRLSEHLVCPSPVEGRRGTRNVRLVPHTGECCRCRRDRGGQSSRPATSHSSRSSAIALRRRTAPIAHALDSDKQGGTDQTQARAEELVRCSDRTKFQAHCRQDSWPRSTMSPAGELEFVNRQTLESPAAHLRFTLYRI
jgi:hypothetical protein